MVHTQNRAPLVSRSSGRESDTSLGVRWIPRHRRVTLIPSRGEVADTLSIQFGLYRFRFEDLGRGGRRAVGPEGNGKG